MYNKWDIITIVPEWYFNIYERNKVGKSMATEVSFRRSEMLRACQRFSKDFKLRFKNSAGL